MHALKNGIWGETGGVQASSLGNYLPAYPLALGVPSDQGERDVTDPDFQILSIV